MAGIVRSERTARKNIWEKNVLLDTWCLSWQFAKMIRDPSDSYSRLLQDARPADAAKLLLEELIKKRSAFIQANEPGVAITSNRIDGYYHEMCGFLHAMAAGNRNTGSDRLREGTLAMLDYFDSQEQECLEGQSDLRYICNQVLRQGARFGLTCEGFELEPAKVRSR